VFCSNVLAIHAASGSKESERRGSSGMDTTAYPDLATAAVKGTSPVNGAMERTFIREAGVKG